MSSETMKLTRASVAVRLPAMSPPILAVIMQFVS
jgi:hypothetical protein